MATVRLQGVSKRFGEVVAVKELTATISDGAFVSLLGPSGCGKTTVLRMVAGFETPSSGEVWIGDERVSGSGVHIPPNQRQLGMVFQAYAVWPHMTVFDNVAYPLRVRNVRGRDVTERVNQALSLVQLDGLEKRTPGQLSGGQQQRVALARAIVAEPRVLLLDEPLSNLDAKLREELRLELKILARRLGITVLNVTHDQAEAMSMSDEILVMEHGSMVQSGSPREVYERPASRYVAGFVGTASFLPASVTAAGVCCLDGDLGFVAAETGSLTPGTRVDLLIRPAGLRLASGSIPATVVSTLYQGDETEVLLTVAGTLMKTKAPGFCAVDPGTEIPVDIQVAAAFRRDRV